MAKPSELVSVAEAAEIVGCTPKTICLKIRDGDLEGQRLGERVWMVRRQSAEALARVISNRSLRKREQVAASRSRSKKPKA